MKWFAILAFLTASLHTSAQGLIGTWQQTEEKTCFDAEMKESETEKELKESMGSSRNAVAKVIKFDKKNRGEEGVFATGSRKGSGMAQFEYKVNGNELLLLDKKSGVMTQQLIIDELTESTLKVHNAKRECEIRIFARIK